MAQNVASIESKMARARLLDRVGGFAIRLAGITILISVLLILVFLLVESSPLILQSEKHPGGTLDKMLLPEKYSGYKESQYIWQTEAGEGGEEKFGVPLLLVGTIKGAFWGMLFSVPLALLTALYVAEFAHSKVRFVMKAAIELLAGVPTVIVGFFAFATISTMLNHYYAAHTFFFTSGQWILLPMQVVVFFVASSVLAARILPNLKGNLKKTAGGFAAAVGGALVAYLFMLIGESILGGALQPVFGVTEYRQLNGMLAGLSLCTAIVPAIFSVSEDSMRAVPQNFREASLALGAGRWETAVKVVMPAAFSGIYAAVMLGLARAVGETMIVLMASGNTPIFNLSPFTGMRTMSAAIAIEASEKARFSTGYHVLFFVGLTLFLFTFVLNAVTRLMIERMKKYYGTGQ